MTTKQQIPKRHLQQIFSPMQQPNQENTRLAYSVMANKKIIKKQLNDGPAITIYCHTKKCNMQCSTHANGM